MHWSSIQRLRPGSIAAANPAGTRLNRKNKYVPVHTSMYSFTDSCTAMYLHVPPYTVQVHLEPCHDVDIDVLYPMSVYADIGIMKRRYRRFDF